MAPSLAHDQTEVQADASSGSHLAWLRAEEERAVLACGGDQALRYVVGMNVNGHFAISKLSHGGVATA